LRTLFLALTLLLTLTSHADKQQQRIDFIQQQFEQAREHSQIWQQGWLGILGTATAVQSIGAYTVEDNKHQYDMTVGAVTSFLGTADMFLNPMKSHHYSVQLQQISSSSVTEKTDKLQQAEFWLAKAAAREAYEQSWTNHLLAGLVNGLAGLAVAYDDKRPIDGWLTFATGFAVSEFKVYTAPQTMMAAQKTYQNSNYSPKTAKAEQQRLFIAASGPHVMVSWKF
jgi:ABC-type multidrug transport system fused ATPase/permease subunit